VRNGQACEARLASPNLPLPVMEQFAPLAELRPRPRGPQRPARDELAMEGPHLIGRWPEPARRQGGLDDVRVVPLVHGAVMSPLRLVSSHVDSTAGVALPPSAPIWLGRSMEQIRRGHSD
jgi:hypothetical protein